MGDEDGANWNDWAKGGFHGPPPWRRGFRTMYFVTSFALFAGLLTVFWLATSGRWP